MASARPNPPPLDLGALIQSLCRAGIEYIVVGGLAAVAQGAPVTTFDLDIVHRQTPDNIRKLHALLQSIGARLRRPDDKILSPTVEDLGAKGHLLLKTRFGPLDVLAFIEKGWGFEELSPHSTEIDFHGHKVKVLNLEAILELKRDTTDPRDRQRLPLYEETLRLIRGKMETGDV
jgi:hypothetical protein